jgi:hypothetical protein
MKSRISPLFLLLFLTLISGRSYAQSLPEFRPALLGRGPRSLVNQINTDSLMKRGQGEGTVMFSCWVSPLGGGHSMQVYRATANTALLQKEILDRCQMTQFEPAVYHKNRIWVNLTGTIVFFITNGKPHLRAFLNQEEQDLKHGSDFIAPQFTLASGNSEFKGIYWPVNAPGHDGAAGVTMDVTDEGKVVSAKVAWEYPPGLGFGAAVASPIRDAWFIPGFRNGKRVACRSTFPVIFFGRGLQMRSP